MPAPKPDPIRCDVPGCGMLAEMSTDGTEEDVQGLGRASIPDVNLCARHPNWSHSDDALRFAATDTYKNRVK
jgi:hypothetical protein